MCGLFFFSLFLIIVNHVIAGAMNFEASLGFVVKFFIELFGNLLENYAKTI